MSSKQNETGEKQLTEGQRRLRKAAGIVLDVVIALVLVFALFVTIVTVQGKKASDGTAEIFGYQLRFVQSGSMEKCPYTDVSDYQIKSIRVKSCLFVKVAPTDEEEIREWYKTLQVGDVLTFSDPDFSDEYKTNENRDGKIVTHRVVKIEPKENGKGYIITLKGDYRASEESDVAEQVFDTEKDTPATAKYIIGKVTRQSYLLGLLVYALKKPVGIICMIIVPCLLMIVIQIFRIVDVVGGEKKKKLAEQQAQKDSEIEELRRQLAALQGNTSDQAAEPHDDEPDGTGQSD